MKEQIQLSDHFTYGRLIRFTLPSIGMMIFMSFYSVVDGYFVSNFAGKTPFAALNLNQAKWHKDNALRVAETQLRYWTKKVQQLREAQE